MEIHSDGPAPYTSPKSIIDFTEAYRQRGLTVPFTPEVLVKAGVSETLAPRTLTSLKLLTLVTDDDQPSPQLIDLRKAPETEYKDRFAALIRAVYAEVFSYVDPATDPSDRIRDAFRSYTPVGQQGRMVTLFIGLCEYAGIIETSPERKAAAAGGSASRRRSTPRTRKPAQPAKAPLGDISEVLFSTALGTGRPSAPGGHPLVQGLLRELPPVGARWPEDKMRAWVDLQRAVFNVLYEITPGGQPN